MSRRLHLAAALLGVLLLGCALTSKSDPVAPRYFEPRISMGKGTEAKHSRLTLRLQRVRAGSHIKERIIFRGPGNELRFYEEQRWAELPQAYLRRTLSHVLFVEHGIRRVTSGPSHNLEVDLLSFSEVVEPEHLVRVELHVLLHDEGRAILEELVTVERPLTDVEPGTSQAVAEALGTALREAVDRTADMIIRALSSSRGSPKDGSGQGANGPASSPPPEP